MIRELKFGKPSRGKGGHVGARARVTFESGEWTSHYQFDTHGMKSDDVAAQLDQMDAYHDAKSTRLTGFRDIMGMEFESGYRVVDCTIFDKGVTLYLDVRKVETDGRLTKVAGFPIQRKCRRIEDVPANEAIVEMLRAALPIETEDLDELHAEFEKKVKDKLGAKVKRKEA